MGRVKPHNESMTKTERIETAIDSIKMRLAYATRKMGAEATHRATESFWAARHSVGLDNRAAVRGLLDALTFCVVQAEGGTRQRAESELRAWVGRIR